MKLRSCSRVIAAVVVCFFTWTSGGVFCVAHAAMNVVTKEGERGSARPSASPEERLSRITAGLRTTLGNAGIGIEEIRQKLKSGRSEIEALDKEIRKEFVATEKQLRESNLPDEILRRHNEFIKQYDDNLTELKEGFLRAEKAKDRAESESGIEKTLRRLEKADAPSHHKSLNPNIPRLQPKTMKREPRMKKEEFEKELKDDKHVRMSNKRIMVASIGSLAGLLTGTAENAVDLPTADDLAETPDVQFTSGIRAKARELENNPVKIYEWVRNNILFVPTYGSIQGADQCLGTRQCNDVDTASLLIALLRASGIHARYAYGTIEAPVDRVMGWAGGMSNPLATAELFVSGGIPVKLVYDGGTIRKLRLEHAWVEAWIDYFPSRGAKHKAGEGDTWIPLDASFKQQRTEGGLDLSAAAAFDTQTFISRLTGSSTISEPESYATSVRCASVSQYQEGFRNRIRDHLASEHPDATFGQVIGATKLVEQSFPYLLGTLPYQTIVNGGVYAELPSGLRHTVTFDLINNDTRSPDYSETTLSLTMALPRLAGKRVTLSYSPATGADEAVISSYVPAPHSDGTPISLAEYPSSLPAYLIQVKAELRVDGVVVASGTGPGLGGNELFSIRTRSPNLPDGVQELPVKAGEYLGIAFGAGPVTREDLEGVKTSLEETAARLKAGNLPGLTKDDILGGFLHASALANLAEVDTLSDIRARVMGIADVRRPSSSVVTLMLATNYFFGIPRSISVAGPSNPEMGFRAAIAPKDGNRDKARRYLLLSGLDASATASALQEYLLSGPGYPVTSVSAVKAMNSASEQAVPLYRITRSNSAATIGGLQLAEEVEQALTNEAGADLTLIVPRRDVAFGAWSGVGYGAVDSPTGNNYTNLNGPPSVVQGMPWIGRSILLGLLPSNAEPPSTLSSSVITDSFIAGLDGIAAGLAALPARPASDAASILTTSLLYDRLGDQLGCYLDLDSPPVSTGACMATYLSLLCTAMDTPLIADRNNVPAADAGPDRSVGTNETVTLDGSSSSDPDNDPLVFRWRLTSAPQGSVATLSDATAVSPSFTPDAAGVYTLELVVSDGKSSSAADTVTITAFPATVKTPSLTGLFTEEARNVIKASGLSVGSITAAPDGSVAAGKVTSQSPAAGTDADRGSSVGFVVSTGAGADTEPPVVSVSLDRSPPLYAAGTPVRVTAAATDKVGVSSIEITVDGAPVTMGVPVTIIDTAGYAAGSRHAVAVTARDISRNAATATATFGILDPADTAAPKVSITSPAADAAVTSPVDIIGTVSDTNLFEYTLAYAPAGTNSFTVFARGNRPVTAGVLGRLDPTLMRNGVYDIILTAVDANGNTTSYSTRYRVTGDLKVGNFTVSFTDLSIPVSGIPVTVTRTYDSRNKTSGDFGFGWTIDIQSVKIEENAVPGEGWSQISSGGQLPTYCLGSDGERYVTVTLPDGRVEEFDLTVTPRCQALAPIQYPTVSYTPRPGTTSTLKAKNAGPAYVSTSGVILDLDTFEPYNPTGYLLTTADGTAYDLDQGFGVRSVTDTNGNTITYSSSGVTHSSGRSISFSRDAKGRITQVTDPAGKTITYGYDANGNLESVTDQEKNVSRYTYNATHGLVDLIDPLKRKAVRNEYDTSGRLVAHIDGDGKRIEYTHDIAGRQEVVKDRNNNVTVYIYDDNGRVLKKTDPNGKSTLYSYDGFGNKLSETDPLGNATSWTYENKRVLTETRTVNGEKLTTSYTYNSLGKVLTMKDPLGLVTTNTYDDKGNLLTTKDALNHTTTNIYDARGNLQSTTDALNNTTSYEYDAYGNMTKQTKAGVSTSYTYDVSGNKLTETDGRRNTTTYNYDGTGKLKKVTDALKNVTTYEYDAAGNKTSETSPLNLVTSYVYDTANRLVETHYPDGTTTKTGYDPEGNRTSTTDQMNRVTTYEYNGNKQLTKTLFADGTFKSYGYDDAGRQTTVTDELGHVTTRKYDPLGRVEKIIDPELHETNFKYDANGNRTEETDANKRTTTFTYELNRLVKTTLPGGQSTTITYDALGRKESETDAALKTTRFKYDERGNLVKVIDAASGVTTYEYDANSNRTAIIDAKTHRTSFVYDELNRLVSKTMPNTGVETYRYDAAGNQVEKVDAKGRKILYTYEKGRLKTRTYPDGSTVGFTYTDAGKRATVTDKRGTTTYGYHPTRGWLASVTNPDGKSIGYTYNNNGIISAVTSLAGTISYKYTDSGRLHEVHDPQGSITTYGYDPAGNRTGLAYPNGTSVSYGYDDNNRLTSLSHKDGIGQVIASYAYTLGPIGNRTRIDEANGISRNYTIDDLYRLTREEVADPANAQTYANDFTYDAVGNRQKKTYTPYNQPGFANDYTYNDADQLLSENGITYGYDLNGNLETKTDGSGTTTYTYDYDNRLVKVTSPTGTTSYVYDADGNRVSSTTAAGTVNYLVDTNRGLSQVVAEYKTDGTVIASYTYADDLISMTRGGQTYWYHFDGLGSTRLLTDASGAVTDSYDYDAFGNLIARTGATENPFLFTGQRYDANTGFYHLRARYYQPETGRFTVVDPYAGDIYSPATLHKYLYCSNDPINRIDPTGMFSLFEFDISASIRSTLGQIANLSRMVVSRIMVLTIRGMYWYFDNQLKIALAELISAGGLAFLDYAAEQLANNTQPVPESNTGEWIESKVGANATDYEVADDFRDETATSFKKHGGRMDQVLSSTFAVAVYDVTS